jgi:hypothetical protein
VPIKKEEMTGDNSQLNECEDNKPFKSGAVEDQRLIPKKKMIRDGHRRVLIF